MFSCGCGSVFPRECGSVPVSVFVYVYVCVCDCECFLLLFPTHTPFSPSPPIETLNLNPRVHVVDYLSVCGTRMVAYSFFVMNVTEFGFLWNTEFGRGKGYGSEGNGWWVLDDGVRKFFLDKRILEISMY